MFNIEELDAILERTERIKNTLKDIETLTEGKEDKFIPASISDRLLTVNEVAERLCTTVSRVNILITNGLIPCLVIGNRKVRESTLVKFMAQYEGYNLNGKEITKVDNKDLESE